MGVRWAAMVLGARAWLVLLGVGLGGCQPAPEPVLEPAPFNGVGYIVINAPIAPRSRELFIQDVEKLRAAGAREIDIGLNSPGGVIQSAEEIVDFMQRDHRDHGVTFKAYNIGMVASAATYVFLNAQDRYASPRGAFLFHAAGLMSNGVITSERLRESAATLDAYEQKIRATLVSRTHLSEQEAQIYVHRTVLLSADDARRDGIVDGIAELQVPRGVRGYIIANRPPAAANRPAPAAEQTR